MHFSSVKNDSGSKVTKIAVVGLFHLALAIGLIHTMRYTHIIGAKPVIDVTLPPEISQPPVEPPDRTVEPTPLPAPTIKIPEVEVKVEKAEFKPELTGETTRVVKTDTGPEKTVQVGDTGGKGLVPVISTPAKMRTAVLADGCALPDYPRTSARNGDTGTVTLALLVAANGKVVDSRIDSSSGHRELDKAAQAALSMCKFKAATNGGVAEQAWSQIAYVWTLD